jgi:hypothetical protein
MRFRLDNAAHSHGRRRREARQPETEAAGQVLVPQICSMAMLAWSRVAA